MDLDNSHMQVSDPSIIPNGGEAVPMTPAEVEAGSNFYNVLAIDKK